MNDCPKSVYKDDRHEWYALPVMHRKSLKVVHCSQCHRIILQQLTSSGDVAGDVWDNIAIGTYKP